MQKELKRVVIKPFSKDKFELMQEYEIEPANLGLNGSKIQIPKGYKTNGADIPRIFWCIFPPNSPRYLSAVLVHDFLCDEAEFSLKSGTKSEFSFKFADEVLKQMMLKLGCKRAAANLFYCACRIYHLIIYRR